MSTTINKRQLIAAELLGVGHRPSDVAKKLALRRETISRWQVNPDFILAKEKAYLEVLSNIIKESIRAPETHSKKAMIMIEEEKIAGLSEVKELLK